MSVLATLYCVLAKLYDVLTALECRTLPSCSWRTNIRILPLSFRCHVSGRQLYESAIQYFLAAVKCTSMCAPTPYLSPPRTCMHRPTRLGCSVVVQDR